MHAPHLPLPAPSQTRLALASSLYPAVRTAWVAEHGPQVAERSQQIHNHNHHSQAAARLSGQIVGLQDKGDSEKRDGHTRGESTDEALSGSTAPSLASPMKTYFVCAEQQQELRQPSHEAASRVGFFNGRPLAMVPVA